MNSSWLVVGSILLIISFIIFIGINFRIGLAAYGLESLGLICVLPFLVPGILIIIFGLLAPKGPGFLK